jgi:hypothetical protein
MRLIFKEGDFEIVICHFCYGANTKNMEKNQEKTLNVIYNGNHSTYEEFLAICHSRVY